MPKAGVKKPKTDITSTPLPQPLQSPLNIDAVQWPIVDSSHQEMEWPSPVKDLEREMPSKNKTLTIPTLPKLPIKNKTTLELIQQAIQEISGLNSKKGTSVVEIKKWIIANSDHSINVLNGHLKKAIEKGIENGTVIRPRGQEHLKGAVGSLCLPRLKPKKVPGILVEPQRQKKELNGEIESVNAKSKKAPKQKVKKSPNVPEVDNIPNQNLEKTHMSDTEITIWKERKSLKKYPSDTEADFIKEKNKRRNGQKKIRVLPDKENKPLTAGEKPKIKQAKEAKVLPKANKKPGVKKQQKGQISDSEIVVKKPNRQSAKINVSDSEAQEATKDTEKNAKQISDKQEKKPTKKNDKALKPAKKIVASSSHDKKPETKNKSTKGK